MRDLKLAWWRLLNRLDKRPRTGTVTRASFKNEDGEVVAGPLEFEQPVSVWEALKQLSKSKPETLNSGSEETPLRKSA